jgi:VanZ family protein
MWRVWATGFFAGVERHAPRGRHAGARRVAGHWLAALTLSLVMEMTQSYLPVRVASNVDLGLNVAGAWLGA